MPASVTCTVLLASLLVIAKGDGVKVWIVPKLVVELN
jgi:hypothetical protein